MVIAGGLAARLVARIAMLERMGKWKGRMAGRGILGRCRRVAESRGALVKGATQRAGMRCQGQRQGGACHEQP